MSLTKDPVADDVLRAKVKLLLTSPFIGPLAARLDVVDASKWCKTAATDGMKLYYNREFIKALTKEELLFLVAHEVLHCVFDHLGRRGVRDAKIWNAANDYIVNYTLHQMNMGKMPEGGLYDAKFNDEMSSEQVYRILEQNAQKVKSNSFDEHPDLGGSDGDGDGSGGSGNGPTISVEGGPDGPPRMTEEDLQKVRNEMKAAVLSAAQNAGAGNVPASIARLIEDFTNPVMDWRALLEMHIQSQVKGDFTFQNPSRRSWIAGVILPGQKLADTIEVAVSIDTSGSMTDEMLRDFLSEVRGIMETFDDFKLWLWTFDTKVYNPVLFTPNNLDEIATYKPMGGGGTYFTSNWEFMRDPIGYGFPDLGVDVIEPKRFVMFTDGYDGGDAGLAHADWTDTLFIIHGRDDFNPGFGMVATYDKNEKK